MSTLILPNQQTEIIRCTFCNRTHSEVRHMIAAPQKRAHICNDCVATCVRLLREREPANLPPVSKWLRG